MDKFRVIGLMSGTSLDGIDAALITTDGENFIERDGFLTVPYDDTLRQRIRGCLNIPPECVNSVTDVERDLTIAHAETVKALLRQRGLKPSDVHLIGFHGQTIAHAPEKQFTCQLGDGALLAKLTGIDVVNDFRTADVQSGGQGAPLAPIYHAALSGAREKPVVFLNIGGVANVTYIGTKGEMIAFDTGPGNALLDDWMLKKTGQRYDEDGKAASRGKVDEKLLGELMSHEFFAAVPPKSIDRNIFVSQAWKDLSLEDGAATLAAFTVAGVMQALKFMPEKPKAWIVSGGGRLNRSFMLALHDKLHVPVVLIEELGLNGDAIEAEAFAYMAVRSLRGLPISFPHTTGVARPMTGGRLSRARDVAA
ncbi:MAG: anhydro-N-acetylmuramic acid kinase [Alphaproteobacteria bacterium]